MQRPPDILWILTTQWRGQALGCAGDSNARTPHIDALAAQGTMYSGAVTPHPFGPFARAALLTGVPSPENGIRNYFDPLPRTSRTIAHRLGEMGYETAFFGKWHLSKRDPSAPLVGEAHARQIVAPTDRGGFMLWEGFESGFLLNDPWLHGTRVPEPAQFPGYQSDVLCKRAEDFIVERSTHAERPSLFYVLSLEAPHPPYLAPAAGIVAQPDAAIALPANVPLGGECEAEARHELAGYYAHIEATDRAIGRLLANASLDEAIVVFTSVHGDMHGAHGLFRKGWPYEESLRVPLIVRMPGWCQKPEARSQRPEAGDRPFDKLPPSIHYGVRGRAWGKSDVGCRNSEESPLRDRSERTAGHTRSIHSEVVSLMDLHDWTLGWARGDCSQPTSQITESGTQNPNFRSAPFVRCSMPSVVDLPHQCDRAWRAARTATHKLVVNADGSPWLFFDLEHDLFEMNNLAASPEHAAEMEALRKALLSGMRSKKR
jgi:arylsulfatase A-like enzyme